MSLCLHVGRTAAIAAAALVATALAAPPVLAPAPNPVEVAAILNVDATEVITDRKSVV